MTVIDDPSPEAGHIWYALGRDRSGWRGWQPLVEWRKRGDGPPEALVHARADDPHLRPTGHPLEYNAWHGWEPKTEILS